MEHQNLLGAFFRAAKKNNIKQAAQCLANGLDINAGDENGNTALFFAAKEGHYAMVEFLLQHNAQSEIKNKKEEMPLKWCFVSYLSRSRKFEKQHPELAIGHFDSLEELPKSLRSLKEHLLTLELIFANIKNPRYKGFMITKKKHVSDVIPKNDFILQKIMIRQLSDYYSDSSYAGWRLRDYANEGSLRGVRFCIEEMGADINGKGVPTTSPLLSAIVGDRLEIINYFIEKGVDLQQKDQAFNCTPAEYARNIQKKSHIAAILEQAELDRLTAVKDNTPDITSL